MLCSRSNQIHSIRRTTLLKIYPTLSTHQCMSKYTWNIQTQGWIDQAGFFSFIHVFGQFRLDVSCFIEHILLQTEMHVKYSKIQNHAVEYCYRLWPTLSIIFNFELQIQKGKAQSAQRQKGKLAKSQFRESCSWPCYLYYSGRFHSKPLLLYRSRSNSSRNTCRTCQATEEIIAKFTIFQFTQLRAGYNHFYEWISRGIEINPTLSITIHEHTWNM